MELRRVIAARPHDELTLGDLTDAVLAAGTLDSAMLKAIRDSAISRYIGHVLNRAKIKTADGRRVRAFQTYTKVVHSAAGETVQQNIWKHIDEMNRKQWLAVVAMRKKHVKDSWEKLVADNDYWNTNVAGAHGWRQVELKFV